MEDLIRKVLDKDENSENVNAKLFPDTSALSKFKEGFSNRKIQDIMRCEISEMKELSEVMKDFSNLILQTINEKRQLKASL
jgi:hypothetical protein